MRFENIDVTRSEQNVGFIFPNNELAEVGSGDYVICLNSDTKVFPGWDSAMISFLNDETVQVGYLGGVLDSEGYGHVCQPGYDIDYVMGWCFCIARRTYNTFGLFNKQLRFAYCEDSI